MKISTTLLLTTTFALGAPHPTSHQHLKPNPAICTPMSRLRLYVNDLNIYPTQSDLYMAEAQALLVDEGLQCPTSNGILDAEKPASDACRKNQEIKNAIDELKISSPEYKRMRLKGLDLTCVMLDKMVDCPTK